MHHHPLESYYIVLYVLLRYMRLRSNDLDESEFKPLILARVKEIEKFELYRRNVRRLLAILNKFKSWIDYAQLDAQCSVLDKCSDVDLLLKLDQICRSAPIRQVVADDLSAYEPEIIYFPGVDGVFMKTIELIIGLTYTLFNYI